MKTKTKTKRVKGWTAVWSAGALGGIHAKRADAKYDASGVDGICKPAAGVVRVVEVYKGEVVVNVERLGHALGTTGTPPPGVDWHVYVLQQAGAVKP